MKRALRKEGGRVYLHHAGIIYQMHIYKTESVCILQRSFSARRGLRKRKAFGDGEQWGRACGWDATDGASERAHGSHSSNNPIRTPDVLSSFLLPQDLPEIDVSVAQDTVTYNSGPPEPFPQSTFPYPPEKKSPFFNNPLLQLLDKLPPCTIPWGGERHWATASNSRTAGRGFLTPHPRASNLSVTCDLTNSPNQPLREY